MSDIDSVVGSINDLNTATLRSAVEFQGFTKSITRAAASTEGAGKAWTTFSRLVSGTPIWALQNKLRAYLSILAGFENRSKANTKAMKAEEQKFVKKVQSMKIVNEQYETMNRLMNEAIEKEVKTKKGFNTDLGNKEIEKAIKNTKEYNLAIMAGASEKMAMAKGTIFLNKRMKDFRAEEKAITRAAKETYAFDKNRIKTAELLAKKKAKEYNLSKKDTKDYVKRAKQTEEQKMSKEQNIILNKTMAEKGTGMPDIKELKPLLALAAPVAGIFKLAKDRKKIALKMMKFTNSLKGVLDIAFRYFLFGVLAAIAFMALIPVLYAVYETIKPFAEDIKHYGQRLLDFGKQIIESIMTFVNSGFDAGMKTLGPLLDTAIGLGLDALSGLWKIGTALLIGLVDGGIAFIDRFFKDDNFRNAIADKALAVGKIILAVWFAKTLLSNAIQLIGIYALPVMIWVLGAVVLYKLGQWIFNNFDLIIEKFVAFLKWYGNLVISIGEAILNFFTWNNFSNMAQKLGKWFISKIEDLLSFFSNGGIAGSSPVQIVGERGPELVKMPQGSRIYNHQQSKGMVRNRGMQINNYITINARDTSDAELRRIADKIGNMVNNRMNRTSSTRTLG